MPVIARYDFDDCDTTAIDSDARLGIQNGFYANGAASRAGQAVFDGANDRVTIARDPAFQLSQGTLEIEFTQTKHVGHGPNTVLSRDSAGDTPGGYRIEISAKGAVVVTHETGAGPVVFCTDDGFLSPCDTVRVTYSWGEAAEGRLIIENLTRDTGFTAPVPAGLTMDMGAINQNWMVGAGQSGVSPGSVKNLDAHFAGKVEYLQFSDSIDTPPPPPNRDGIVDGTLGDDLIGLAYVDADGDRIDAGDAIIPGDGPDDDRVFGLGGNDTIYGERGDDTILGGTGDDLIFGGPGEDVIDGEEGDDTTYGGDGSDLVSGGEGDDLIDTSGGGDRPLPDRGYPGLYAADRDPLNDRDTVDGGDGDDTIRTGDDSDLVFGGHGDDLIDAGFDDDTVYGGRGEDTIIGAEGADLVFGGHGDDLIYGGFAPDVPDAINIPDDQGDRRPDNGNDALYGGSGSDTIFGMDDADLLFGEDGYDLLDGGVDDDTVFGGAGNDRIIGSHGADSMFGGADRDTFIVSAVGHGIGDDIDGGEEGDDFDTLDLRGAGPLRITYVEDNPENGTVAFFDGDGNETGQLAFVNIENIVPCFTPGTMIATPQGEVPVENLRFGDKIITRDNGLQEIRWTGARHLDWSTLCANPHLNPILIRQGSLGNGLPERDTLVSPNHRMLVANDRTALYFEEHEVLVAAKHLTGAKGVQSVEAAGITYLHFMFDKHEVVLANGAWTESFQPGDYSLKGLGNAQRSEIFEVFPELKSEQGVEDYAAARRTLKRHEASLLLR